MAVLLEVGLYGIENKMALKNQSPIGRKYLHHDAAEERKEAGITDLPSTYFTTL